MDNEQLVEQIRAMRPWHHDIEINDGVSTGKVFSPDGKLLPADNDNVSLISPRGLFESRAEALYPHGLSGKRFLDCACNAGAYCFYARELGADFSFGFDVRKHWIDQAQFVQQNRQGFPTDQIEFREMDLYDLPTLNLEPFDYTYFSGIFYHLPDPITGLKIAADLTRDILLLNTAAVAQSDNPLGMTMVYESTELVMSGVHRLAWFPNGPEILVEILKWLGFQEMKLSKDVINHKNRRRLEIVASRQKGRLDGVQGEFLVYPTLGRPKPGCLGPAQLAFPLHLAGTADIGCPLRLC